MTTVVISQPQYFPWSGFFELLATADVYVHLDDVQFSKGSFTNRIQVRHDQGTTWMTVPLAGGGSFRSIRDLEASGTTWKASHRELLRQAYRQAPFADLALGVFDRASAGATLFDVLVASIEQPAAALGLAPTLGWRTASRLGIGGTSWPRVLDIVRALGGTRYVTAHGGAAYLDHEAFEAAGIAVEYMAYSKTPWRQAGPAAFSPYVTVLDLLAHEGPGAAAALRPATSPWRQFTTARTAS